MKSEIKRVIPRIVLDAYRRARGLIQARKNRKLTPGEVFSEIYRNNVWGTDGSPFYSGTGSATLAITEPYVEAVTGILRGRYGGLARVVDLGCGDFVVGRQIANACSVYVGVDVVPELIEHLRANKASANVSFECMDIIRDELPPGDVCLIRQVLQHLSNEQIKRVLCKLDKYDLVIITEHYPSIESRVVKNLDKVHGGDIRLAMNSGVYLDEAPFNIPRTAMRDILQVPGHQDGGESDSGIIRTVVIERERWTRPVTQAK